LEKNIGDYVVQPHVEMKSNSWEEDTPEDSFFISKDTPEEMVGTHEVEMDDYLEYSHNL
jgi:hypothetical protein